MVPSSDNTPKINHYPDFCILYINGIIMCAFYFISGFFFSIVQIWDSYILVWIVVHSSFALLYSISLCNYNKCIHPVHCCWVVFSFFSFNAIKMVYMSLGEHTHAFLLGINLGWSCPSKDMHILASVHKVKQFTLVV